MLQLSTAFIRNTLGLAANNPQHSIMLQVSTAFNHAALNSLHSIGFHFFMLPGMHCIKSRCMESIAFNWDAFYQAAWNPLHSSMLHGIHCIQSGCMLPGCMYYTAFNDIAWNPLPSIGMFWPCCIKSTAFNRDALGLTASTALSTIGIHFGTIHGVLYIQWRCMESTALNRNALCHASKNPLHSFMPQESTAINHAA